MDSLRKCDNTLEGSMIQLDKEIKRNLIFWPKKYRTLLIQYLIHSSNFKMCGYMKPVKDAVNLPVDIKRQYSQNCSDEIEVQFDRLRNLELQIIGHASDVLDTK